MKQATLCLLVKDNEILLAMKKRGFGVGKWNGVGGKIDYDKVNKFKEIINTIKRNIKNERRNK